MSLTKKAVSQYLQERILEGEHQSQDFKFAINDSKKIARSLAAFANTEGGRLLVGVKDNGRIAGVASEEEQYMIEAAATMYCKPPVYFETREWEIEKKKVVEVIIPKSKSGPHKAPANDGRFLVFVRVDDQNLLANKILLRVWARQKKGRGTFFELKEPEQRLLTFLNQEASVITLSRFARLAAIPRHKAESILVNLIVLGVIEIVLTEKGAFYKLKESPEPHHEPTNKGKSSPLPEL